MKVSIVGLKETITNLNRIRGSISKTKKTAQEQSVSFGVLEAKRRIPVDTGANRDNISFQNFEDESWIISLPVPHDLSAPNESTHKNDKPRAVNVLINKGDRALLGWDSPKSGEFYFMDNSVEPTKQEFIRLLNVGIQEATK